jgi:hypothetical protein
MNHEEDGGLDHAERDLLFAVIDGRAAGNDVAVMAASKANPQFASELAGAIRVRALLADFRASEQAALAAGPSPHEATAVAAARRAMGLPIRLAARRGPWTWAVLSLAAAMVLVFALLRSGERPAGPSDQVLGGSLTLELVQGALVANAVPGTGEHYEFVLRAGGREVRLLRAEVGERSIQLPGDLSSLPQPLQVQVRLMRGMDELASSPRIELPAGR